MNLIILQTEKIFNLFCNYHVGLVHKKVASIILKKASFYLKNDILALKKKKKTA